MLKVNGQHFEKDGQRFFYLADTCWGAFTSIEMPDWRYYLDTRKSQGFNAIQINILRQWDSSLPLADREPFAITTHEDGSYEYDFTKINEAYFDRAEEMLQEMVKRGMTPVLVLLWGNFVPDTWMAKFVTNNTISLEEIRPYVTYAVKRFKKYDPVYFVSGDVGFTENGKQVPATAIEYYREVLSAAKAEDPKGIYTFHINGESHDLPQEFVDQVDFYSYQSGHGYPGQKTAYEIPQALRNKQEYQGPIVDAELCYEGMTKMRAPEPERYSAYDVRKAAWRAVLSGADAGLGYGTYGIWPWNDPNRPEAKLGSNFNVSLRPYNWRDNLNFRGAKDVAFIKDAVLQYAADGLTPLPAFSKADVSVRAAESSDYYLIYLPTFNALSLEDLGIDVSDCRVIDLQTRDVRTGIVENNVLQMAPIMEDALVIIKK